MDHVNAAVNPEAPDELADGQPLVLPAELTIYTVGELHPQWSAWAKAVAAQDCGDGVLVRGNAVAEVDAAGLQLLVSLQRGFSASGRSFRIVDPSTALTSACSGLGLIGWLDSHSPKGNM